MPTLPKPRRKKYVPAKEAYTGNDNYSLYNSTRWRKASTLYRRTHPLCEVSQAVGEVRPAEVTDHIIPINQGGAIWDERNWMPISHHYHNIKRGLEAHGLDLQVIDTPGGKVPVNREDVYLLLLGDSFQGDQE